MKIGIDLRSLEGGAQHRGIGRYVSELLKEISKIDKKNEYVFFVSSPKSIPPEFNFSDDFRHMLRAGKGKGWRRRVKFIRTLHVRPEPLQVDSFGVDVFFHTDIQQPIVCKKTPVVSVLYDLIPFLYKDIYQTLQLHRYTIPEIVFYFRQKLWWRLAEKAIHEYKNAAAVVSISEYSRKDLIEFVPGIDPEKIIAIPLAAGRAPKPDKQADIKFIKLKEKDFLFYVGGADPRKGLVGLVKDMELVWDKHPDVQLVLAGKEVTDPDVPEARKLARSVKQSSKPKNIHLLGFISDGELAWLYKNARAFVFPSIYEGFGLPILEAMQSSCPVIAYNNTSIPEVAGDAAILVADGKSMAPSINKLLGDSSLRSKMIKAGLEQEKKFTWEKTAKATLAVFERVGKESI